MCNMNQPQQRCSESATSFQQYLSLCLCYGHCCLVISCGIHVWNQNSPNLAGFLFLWEEYRVRFFSQRNKVFPFLPSTQMNRSLTSKNTYQAMQGGPYKIQTRGQDSLLSLIDPRISISLEPQDQISLHLKWDSYNTVESIFTYPRLRISSWSSKASLCCWEACIVDQCSSPLAS